LVPGDGVAILGARDRGTARTRGSLLPEDLGHSSEFDPDTLRDLGMERAGRDTERALTTVAEGFWLHLDVDVMATQPAPTLDPAQDSGLDEAELAELLAPLGASEGLVGVSVVGYGAGVDGLNSSVPDHLVSLLRTLLRE
jgi:arginase